LNSINYKIIEDNSSSVMKNKLLLLYFQNKEEYNKI